MSNAFRKHAGTGLGTTVDAALARSLSGDVRKILLQNISTNPEQPRRHFNEERLAELADSIRESGVLQPILLRSVSAGQYQIVFGERRYRAALLAGLTEIPAMVRDLSAEEAAVTAAVENLQREDLNPYEEAQYKLTLIAATLKLDPTDVPPYLRKLHRNLAAGQVPEHPEHVQQLERLFKELGGSWRTFAVHGLRTLNLPEVILSVLRSGQLEYSKAALISTAPPQFHERLLREAVDEELSLTQLQERLRDLTPKRNAPEGFARLRGHLSARKLEALPAEHRQEAQHLIERLNAIFERSPQQ